MNDAYRSSPLDGVEAGNSGQNSTVRTRYADGATPVASVAPARSILNKRATSSPLSRRAKPISLSRPLTTGRDGPELARVTHGSLAERLSELSPLSALGAGVFVTVNWTDLKGRREANIVAVRALFADLDGAPLSVLKRLSLLPHIIAMTSPSRFHVYWRVNGVETAEFAGLQKRLAALLGSDPSVCDLPRVMRLPGFPHQKDPAAPHLVWFQAREHSGPHEADAFRAALAAAERKGVADKGLIGECRPELRRGRTNGNRAAFPKIHASAPEPWNEIGERRLRSALKAIPAFDRDTWLKVGFALYDLAAADPRWPRRPMWDEWSRTCPEKFNAADQDKTWASFAGDYSGQRAASGRSITLRRNTDGLIR